MPREPHVFVLYSSRHRRCGQFIERADYRVLSENDLLTWSRDLNTNGTIKPLTLHCVACSEDFPATHLRIIEDIDPKPRTLVPEIEIKQFNPRDWIVKRS
ncbi:MAG: hypothetical protein WEB62_07930 [Bacteroidota bacterium]